MSIRDRIGRLIEQEQEGGEPVVTLGCLGGRSFTRHQLEDYVVATRDGWHPLRCRIAGTYRTAYPRILIPDPATVPSADPDHMAEVREAAVRALDAAIVAGRHPELAAEVAAWERAGGDPGTLHAAGPPCPDEPVGLVTAALARRQGGPPLLRAKGP